MSDYYATINISEYSNRGIGSVSFSRVKGQKSSAKKHPYFLADKFRPEKFRHISAGDYIPTVDGRFQVIVEGFTPEGHIITKRRGFYFNALHQSKFMNPVKSFNGIEKGQELFINHKLIPEKLKSQLGLLPNSTYRVFVRSIFEDGKMSLLRIWSDGSFRIIHEKYDKALFLNLKENHSFLFLDQKLDCLGLLLATNSLI